MRCDAKGCRRDAVHNDGSSPDSFCDTHTAEIEQRKLAIFQQCTAWYRAPGHRTEYRCRGLTDDGHVGHYNPDVPRGLDGGWAIQTPLAAEDKLDLLRRFENGLCDDTASCAPEAH